MAQPIKPSIPRGGAALVGVGVALIVLTFLLAFTVYGMVSSVAGLICVLAGSLMLGGRSPRRSWRPDGDAPRSAPETGPPNRA